MIKHFRPPLHPELRFEYHPESNAVYSIRAEDKTMQGGELKDVANRITDRATCEEIAQATIWGYLARVSEEKRRL